MELKVISVYDMNLSLVFCSIYIYSLRLYYYYYCYYCVIINEMKIDDYGR